MSECVVDQAHADSILQVGAAEASKRARAAGSGGRSETAKKHLQLMSEFDAVCEIQLSEVSGKQHKILRTIQGGDGQCRAIVGMFHEPLDYLNQALCA